MNKLKENKQTLDDAEMLIRMLNAEVNRLRHITFRYYLKHGRNIQDGIVILNDIEDFSIDGDIDNPKISIIDYELLGVKSDFMQIQELNNKLGL